MHKYVTNRNVFRDCLKLFRPIIGFRKLSGREFQSDGPATHTESPSAIGAELVGAELVARYDQELSGGGSDNVAVMRHLRLVGTIRRGTEALDHASDS